MQALDCRRNASDKEHLGRQALKLADEAELKRRAYELFMENPNLKLADETELKRRKSICNNCNFWYPAARMGLGKCLKCGCSLAKLKLASEKCPIGKW